MHRRGLIDEEKSILSMESIKLILSISDCFRPKGLSPNLAPHKNSQLYKGTLYII